MELTYEMIEASIFDELGAEVAALGALLETLREREREWLTRQELLAAVQARQKSVGAVQAHQKLKSAVPAQQELTAAVQTRQPHLTRHALNIALQRLKDVPGVESKLARSPLYRWLP